LAPPRTGPCSKKEATQRERGAIMKKKNDKEGRPHNEKKRETGVFFRYEKKELSAALKERTGK